MIPNAFFTRRRRYDVVFYTPFVGWMLSSRSTTPPGGAETQILRLATTLARRGIRVAIVAYGTAENLPIEAEGVRIVPRADRRANKRLVGRVVEVVRIWGALRRAPSRVVVCRCASPELGLVGLFTRLTGRRLVFSSASIIDFTPERLIQKRRDVVLYKLGVRLADGIVVQTKEQINLCARHFSRKSVLIKSLAGISGSPDREPEAFLWVGRLVSYKQPGEYLALAKALPEATFWMVGVPAVEPAEQAFSEETIREAQRIPNLRLLPPRPQAEIEQLMGRAVASVNTAEFEGMPNVLLEAWAFGVPALVLTHDPDGVVAAHGLGWFAQGSHERLVALARELWLTRGERGAISDRCRAYIAAHHGPDAVAEQWLGALELDAPSTAPASVAGKADLTYAG